MSASLVGSEMCIRDRPPPATPAEPLEVDERASPGARKGRRKGGRKVRCCLLYTSDAADDM
eukprot:4962282-Alexandrium_andersonii.AAC.1